MPRKQKKYHYIYKTTCQVTGKFYVGMHSTDNLEDGYLGSGKILGYSRRKYGDENHRKEILEFCSSRDELKRREKQIVNEELINQPLNMNLKYGGDGGWDHISINTLKRCQRAASAAMALKLKDTEFRKEYSRKLSDAQRRVKSEGRGVVIDPKFWLGKKLSNQHIERCKATFAERKHQQGEKNSQFGTCWVTNGTPIKIKKEQLDKYLANGYRRGRK